MSNFSGVLENLLVTQDASKIVRLSVDVWINVGSERVPKS